MPNKPPIDDEDEFDEIRRLKSSLVYWKRKARELQKQVDHYVSKT